MFLNKRAKHPTVAMNEYEYYEVLPSLKQAFTEIAKDERVKPAMRDMFDTAGYLMQFLLYNANYSSNAPQFLEKRLLEVEEDDEIEEVLSD